ncbi:MAG: flagellar biosynthesis protein FlhB [Alphaproteobacteria bacterium]|nr:flagellar biosynthesis protein FlhB [Alphaproteobacteria bacterium]
MADDREQDDTAKTEEPTSKRLQEARDKGQVPNSREVGNAVILLAGTVAVTAMGADVASKIFWSLRAFIERPHSFMLDPDATATLLWAVSNEVGLAILPVLVLLVIVGVGSNLIQHGWVVSVEGIKPQWQKLSPLGGLKRMFSKRGLVELTKSLFKVGIVGTAAVLAVMPWLTGIDQWVGLSVEDMLSTTMALTLRMLTGVVAAMFLIAVLDYGYQWWDHHRQMRMTKQEVRDEGKQQEGDPHIKGKIRALRVQRARRRMMQQVPEADVVVTNPTHYAVALKYDAERMNAPRLVAKGVDQVALRIRQVAEEHGVPLMENPPLARALYAGVELDQEIPEEHYRAVAQIIGYVMKLKGRKLPA